MAEQEKKEARAPEESRRSLLNKIWIGLGLLVLAELVWLVVSFLRPRRPSTPGDGESAFLLAGPAEAFDRNTVTAFPRGQFYLARLEDGGFLAISRKCTHLGCTVPWVEEDRRFACPCHGSSFDITGNVIQAPAPRALDLYAVEIENHVVKVNTSKRIKRGAFQPSQVTYLK